MNVILHISSLKGCSEDPGMSDAILTLDGIQHQLEFLVDERTPSSPPGWTDYACKVSNTPPSHDVSHENTLVTCTL